MNSPFHIVIPARLASTRLPNKPLADIAGAPMIVQVARRAALAGAAQVVVATDAAEVRQACEAHGIRALMTRADHASGSDRLAEGFRLLERGLSKRLLISGVATGVTLEQLIDRLGDQRASVPSAEEVACCVTLGYEAGNTVGNADESAEWVRRNGTKSVRLVTTDWHMPRARMELAHAIGGDVEVIGDSVPSPPGGPSWRVLLREYHKFLVRRIVLWAGAN